MSESETEREDLICLDAETNVWRIYVDILRIGHSFKDDEYLWGCTAARTSSYITSMYYIE